MRRTAITAIAALALAGCASTADPEPPATTAATSVSPACREWIVGELQDGSESIDDAAGNTACGDLTEAELAQAVVDILAELMASQAAQ